MNEQDNEKGKPFPHFTTDEEAEHFLDTADLSEYDFSRFVPMKFELRKKDARINMRIPAAQLVALKNAAASAGIPYQRFIRDAIDTALAKASKKAS